MSEIIPQHPSREQFLQSLIRLGLPEVLAGICGRALYRRETATPRQELSRVVKDMLPSEILFSMVPRLKRLVSLEVSFEQPISFDPQSLAETALKSIQQIQKIGAPNQPLSVRINEEAGTFDLRQPAELLVAAVEGNDGTYSYVAIDRDGDPFALEAPPQIIPIQIVISHHRVNGLTPTPVVRKHPDAYCFISHTASGLLVEFDHLVADGAVMQLLLRSLLTSSTMQSELNLLHRTSDRINTARKMKIPTTAGTGDVLHAIGIVTQELLQSPQVLANVIRSAEHSPHPFFGRIIPIPVTGEALIRGEVDWGSTTDSMWETPLAQIIAGSRMPAYPRRVLKTAYQCSRGIPRALFPLNTPALVTIAPVVPFREEDMALTEVINKTIGQLASEIRVAIPMFPWSMGINVVSRAGIHLPGRDHPLIGYTLSSASPMQMQRFEHAICSTLSRA